MLSRKYAENQKAPYPFFGCPIINAKFWLWIFEFPAALVNFYGAHGLVLIGNARLAARHQMAGNSLRCRQDSKSICAHPNHTHPNQFSVPHFGHANST